MHMCVEYGQFSKDRSRRTGAIIVDPETQNQVSSGWNGFPRKVNDEVDARHVRPLKYKWTEHAERNAFYNAAALGRSTKGCTMYIPWYPCCDCARGIIQCMLKEIVVIEPNWDDPIWKEDFVITKEMLHEAQIGVKFYDNHTFAALVNSPVTS
jgi:dCMP deaminase